MKRRLHGPGERRQSRLALLVTLLATTVGTPAAHAQGPPANPPAAPGARVDAQVAARLSRGKDTDLLQVIVTMKRGTKGGMVNALRAQGARVKHDFSLIEAFAGELPVGLLRALQKNPDVLALSADGVVRPFQSAPPVGTIYTVTNTNNSGAGSLRQAIIDANGHAGADTIQFNIAGTGVQTIAPTSALPTITGQVTIDGYSQAGSSVNTMSAGNNAVIAIELNGAGAGSANGLTLGSGSAGSTIRGLAINRFGLSGIQVSSTNNVIVGNFIGTNAAGTSDLGNLVDGVTISANNNAIGSAAAADRNLLSGNDDEPVDIDLGVTGTVIRGNYIGTNAAGTAAIANGTAGNANSGFVLIEGNNSIVGGMNPGEGNLVSGSTHAGIYITSAGNTVQGNLIGLNAAGTSAIANQGPGVRIGEIAGVQKGASNLIGGTTISARNVIAFNAGPGVSLDSGAGAGNAVLGNSIYSNAGVGIDLSANGVTANDSGDADTGANDLQNFPVLTKAVTSGTQVEVSGTLNSKANSFYRVEFFLSETADSTGYGEGQVYLGAVQIATNGSGNATFRATLNAAVASGAVISATATKSTNTFATFSDTSEFAANVAATLVPANVLVTKSLRGTLGIDSLTETAPLTTRTGSGVTVAVIDSGMLLDGGAASRLKTTRDFTTGNPNPPHIADTDGYGHGTHVAGLIGGNQAELQGVAPGVSYVSLRVLDNSGIGVTSNVIAAVEWAVANKAAYGIDIFNLSLGHPIYEPAATDPLVQAVEAAVRAHIVVVAAAGNYGTNPQTGQVGYAGISSPGNAPSAVTVGALKTFDTATRSDDRVADYGSRGPTWYDGSTKPDVVAPGHRLLAAAATGQTLYTSYPALRQTIAGRPYLTLSGTSMAAAVVSGSVALMIEESKATYGAAPPPNAIKAMLQVSAFPMSDPDNHPYHVLAQGAGALNTAGALTLASAINPTVPVNGYWLAAGVTKSTTIDGQSIAWGDKIVWGDTIIWGDTINTNNVVWGTGVTWGTGVIWGTNIVWGAYGYNYNLFWGQGVIWGTGVTWGTNLVWGTGVTWGTSIASSGNNAWGDVLAAP